MTCTPTTFKVRGTYYTTPIMKVTTQDVINVSYKAVDEIMMKTKRYAKNKGNSWVIDKWHPMGTDVIKLNTRFRPVVMVKHLAIYYMRNNMNMNSWQIADIFNLNRTISHYVDSLVGCSINTRFNNDFKDCWKIMLEILE